MGGVEVEGHSSSLPYVYYLDWFSIHFDFPPRDCFVRSCSRVTAIKLLSCVDIHGEISAVSLEERGEEKSTPNYHYHHIEEKEGDMPFIGKGKQNVLKIMRQLLINTIQMQAKSNLALPREDSAL